MSISKNSDKRLGIIGSAEFVEVAGIKNIPAKIDTGADSSSIWASHIRVTKDGILKFRLFDEGSPFYTGRAFKRTEYKVAVVRSAFGHEQIRYRVYLRLKIKGKVIKVLFYLADRSKNSYPILIGRRAVSKKFYVDVSKNDTGISSRHPDSIKKTRIIQKRLKEDPYKFHRKYIKKYAGGADKIKLKKKGEKNENRNSI